MLRARFQTINMVLRSFFFVLSKIPFVLILIFIGFYSFCINDQGLDLMAAFVLKSVFNSPYEIFFILFLMLWANTIWNVTRVLLNSANLTLVIQKPVEGVTMTQMGKHVPPNYMTVCIEERFARTIYSLSLWVPRLLILTPYALFITGWIRVAGFHKLALPAIVGLLGIAHLLLIVKRLQIVKGGKNKRTQTSKIPMSVLIDRLKNEPGFLQSLKDENVFTIATFTLIMALLVFIYACIAAFGINPIEVSAPGLIVLSGLIFYTVIIFSIVLLGKRVRLPLLFILVLLSVFFSLFNNNHAVETLTSTEDQAMLVARDKLPDSIYFRNWLASKTAQGVYDTSKKNVIFIVAAEGGGIRDCYWTAVLLKELQKRNSSFYNKTFAVTGASGGSVGLGFYYSYLYQNREAFRSKAYATTDLTPVKLDQICSGDFLSRVSFGFLYTDLWQRFLPFKIRAWDRGKYLPQSFDESYSNCLKDKDSSVLRKNYLTMWSGADRYNYPALLLNSLYVEKGAKGIFSPFRLSPAYYSDALDILTVTKRSVTMREGMVCTARFPFVTSPGLLLYDSTQHSVQKEAGNLMPFGHLIDGGGFENKAIQTAQQTALMIKEQLVKLGLQNRFAIKILYLGYGTRPLVPTDDPANAVDAVNEYQKPLGLTYELAPVVGGSNTIFRWIYSAHGLTTRLDSTMNVIDFGLRSKRDEEGDDKHILPLGWFLSAESKHIIDTEVKHKHLNNSYQKFGEAFNN